MDKASKKVDRASNEAHRASIEAGKGGGEGGRGEKEGGNSLLPQQLVKQNGFLFRREKRAFWKEPNSSSSFLSWLTHDLHTRLNILGKPSNRGSGEELAIFNIIN
jgi:hypothetical protein